MSDRCVLGAFWFLMVLLGVQLVPDLVGLTGAPAFATEAVGPNGGPVAGSFDETWEADEFTMFGLPYVERATLRRAGNPTFMYSTMVEFPVRFVDRSTFRCQVLYTSENIVPSTVTKWRVLGHLHSR